VPPPAGGDRRGETSPTASLMRLQGDRGAPVRAGLVNVRQPKGEGHTPDSDPRREDAVTPDGDGVLRLGLGAPRTEASRRQGLADSTLEIVGV